MAQNMTDDELQGQFELLALEEREHQGKLDETIFKMGDLLNEANPDDEMLELLAKKEGYSAVTLKQRRDVARNIRRDERHSGLSWSAHAATAKMKNREERNKLIQQGGKDQWTSPEMSLAVQKKRRELGEIRPARSTPYSADNLRKLNFAGGFDISDGVSVVKGRASIVNGRVQITLDCDHPRIDNVEVTSTGKDTKQIIEFTLGEED
jgi:hypothetical protein